VFAGVTPNEIALVAFLVALVMIAPKVGRIGEVIGGLFERRGPGAGREAPRAPGDPAPRDPEG
jgi:Flp pilus assembly pilin Flp